MKKIIFFLLLSCTVAAGYSQGVKKSQKPSTATQKSAIEKAAAPVLDSITVKFYDKKDTAKAILFVMVEDHSITWLKGYAVSITRILQDNSAVPVGVLYYDDKWQAVKPDDLLQAKPYAWQ